MATKRHAEGLCVDCGVELSDEERLCGHDVCFECYLFAPLMVTTERRKAKQPGGGHENV
jgi:hypothetical protein